MENDIEACGISAASRFNTGGLLHFRPARDIGCRRDHGLNVR